jgi:hypothetical protein
MRDIAMQALPHFVISLPSDSMVDHLRGAANHCTPQEIIGVFALLLGHCVEAQCAGLGVVLAVVVVVDLLVDGFELLFVLGLLFVDFFLLQLVEGVF